MERFVYVVLLLTLVFGLFLYFVNEAEKEPRPSRRVQPETPREAETETDLPPPEPVDRVSEAFAVLTPVAAGELPPRIEHLDSGIVLVLIPAGEYTMGTPLDEPERDRDEAQRQKKIESPFYLGETEITVDNWRRVMGADTVSAELDGLWPMEGVSWHNARKFVDKLNTMGETGWRLPTEVEWEYACRAGTTTPFNFGWDVTPDLANFNARRPYNGGERGERSDGPVLVGSYAPNAWGLYDMHGNMWEWCDDLYEMHPVQGTPIPKSPGASRVIRGGGWPSKGKQLRSGYRDGYPPSSRGEKYGFRVAKSIEEE